MKTVLRTTVAGCLVAASMFSLQATGAGADNMFQIRTTNKTPEMVAEEFKEYAEKKKWQFLGAQKVKQGQVTLVKVCIPEFGQQIWPLGLHLSAMLPCGNFGIYLKDGKTEISMLHARYMQVLHPDPVIEKVSAAIQPLLLEMLASVAN